MNGDREPGRPHVGSDRSPSAPGPGGQTPGAELLRRAKRDGRRIVACTAYDHWSAAVLNRAPVDFLLVGDSVAMVVYGHPSTRAATLEMLMGHLGAVRRGAPDQVVVADIPWLAMEGGVEAAVQAGRTLRGGGADAVKVEAVPGHLTVVRRLVEEGIPVMGHVGLLPQTVTAPEEYRVAGRGREAEEILESAAQLQAAGCFSLVLECVPSNLATEVTAALDIPVIGIGAGADTDGQILVLHDLAGLTPGGAPRFVRRFGDGTALLLRWIEAYAASVQEGRFPTETESYR